MSKVDITWQRMREYTATVDADDLRAALARVAKSREGVAGFGTVLEQALETLDDLDGYQGMRDILELGELIADDPEYFLESLEDDDLNNCSATFEAEVTEIEST